MGLLQKAYETYENHRDRVGKIVAGEKAPLLPVAHNTQKAQIEISISVSGDFMGCCAVNKVDCDTVIPVTVESAGRTGKTPHPFSDQIQYLHPEGKGKYEDYISLLSTWCESPYGHEKARAVLKYLKKGTLLKDLESSGLAKGKINNIDFESCLVRWYVKGATNPKPCWQDLSLFKSWTDYYSAVLGGGGQSGGDICYITGRREQITTNHPNGIIKAANRAKLISANDSMNFTYRGRFTDKDGNQASAVGYYASQKAHNALKWLIANQGFSIGRTSSRWYVCWNPEGKRLPQPDMSFLGFGTDDVEQDAVTPSNYKKQLRDAIKGYKKDLPESAEAIIASFDAATTGRLSLTYYNELQASDFLERVCDWYSRCCWYKRYGKEHYINSPSVYEIIASAYGTEQGGKESRLVPPDKLCGEQGQQLIKCIVERAAMSRSLVQRLFTRANQRQAVSVKSYEAILFVARKLQ